MRIEPQKIKEILFVRNDRFGEFLLNIPVMVVLKEKFPGSKITLVVKPELEELARAIPAVDRVICWDSSKRHKFGEKIALMQKIRPIGCDLALISNPSKEFHVYGFLCGIPFRVGYNRKCGFLLNRKIEDKKFEGLRHEVDYNFDLLRVLGIDVRLSDIRFPLNVKPEAFSGLKVEELGIGGDGFIAVHPWASNPEKEWPKEKFQALVAKLNREDSSKVVLIGGKEERLKAKEFTRGLHLIDLVGKISLIELAALLKKCRLIITNDSGPMHLAAILGIGVVALFRSSPASVSARRWGPVGVKNVIIENDYIGNIETEEVWNAAKKMLG